MGPKLTKEQSDSLDKELVQMGVPVRFLYNGQALGIITGQLCSKNSNVLYHPVYFNFTRETALKIARWLGAKAVFHT